jgi:hypothetical protein
VSIGVESLVCGECPEASARADAFATVSLGVAARIKYGFLLDKMNGRLPVFRTETQECVGSGFSYALIDPPTH